MKHFETDQVDKVLMAYKLKPCEQTLDDLYNSIDHILLAVISKIASNFKKKHPEDFEDIQQNVRITIYKILPKLASISVSGNQVIAIIVKATEWKFKSSYAQYKRKTPVNGTFGDWIPENGVVEIQLESVTGGAVSSEYSNDETNIMNNFYSSMPARIWINSSQYEQLYLKKLPDLIFIKALNKNRFKDKESLIRFLLSSLIEGRNISSILINKRWNISNPSFWMRYSNILLKLAILEVIN